MRRPPGPLCVTQLGKDWIDQGTLARTRMMAPAELLAGPADTQRDDWFRAVRVRRALDRSGPMAQALVQQRLAGIELSDIWPILVQACQDIALYYGGSVVGGAAVGSVAGLFAGAMGAVPGAAAGALVGAQLGGWVLALLGLKSLVEYLGTALPQAMRLYERGFREAWGPGAREGRWSAVPGGDVDTAARHFADGHVIVIMAMLSALVAYLTRGRGDKARLLQEVRDSRRLGPKVADWVEHNEDRLLAHPELKTQEPRIAMASAPRDTGPPMTPSQLRRAREAGPEHETPPKPPQPRMPQKKVRCFEPNDLPQAKIPEFDRQLAGQESGLNDMTVDEYLKGREAFDPANRDPNVARQARADHQQRVAEAMARQLGKEGLSPSEAKAKAAEMAADKMKTLAALHTPDMIAGGKDAIGDFGDRNINSRIGAQWKSRVNDLDTAARSVSKSERGSVKMNAKLERCR